MKKRLSAALWLLIASNFVTLANADEFGIQFVKVGDPANPEDALTGLGRVDQTFEISKLELTWSQYLEFLNEADRFGSNTGDLYKQSVMSPALTFENTRPAGDKYRIGNGFSDRPARVEYNHAARFVNWLQTGGTSYTGGTYEVADSSGRFSRADDVTYWLPNMNEWYKAAFYQGPKSPLQGVIGSDYARYATGKITVPNTVDPPGNAESAQYDRNGGDVLNRTLDGGSYPLALSHYGTLDQSGNLKEILEGVAGQIFPYREAGGSYFDSAFFLDAENTVRSDALPTVGAIRVCRAHVPTNTEAGGVDIFKAIELTWPSQACFRYQIRSSSDMTSWTDDGDPLIGTGADMSAFRRITEERRYYKVFHSE